MTKEFFKLRRNWGILMTFFMFAFIVMFTWQHELTHQIICQEFGGTPTGMSFNISDLTESVNCINNTELGVVAQANVESFGYQAMIIFIFLIIIITAFGMLMISMKEREWQLKSEKSL